MKLVIYTEKETQEIPIQEDFGRKVAEAVYYKATDKLKEYFSSIKDTEGETHNIDFDLVTGFEFRR